MFLQILIVQTVINSFYMGIIINSHVRCDLWIIFYSNVIHALRSFFFNVVFAYIMHVVFKYSSLFYVIV